MPDHSVKKDYWLDRSLIAVLSAVDASVRWHGHNDHNQPRLINHISAEHPRVRPHHLWLDRNLAHLFCFHANISDKKLVIVQS